VLFAPIAIIRYESEGLDEMALGCYLDARKFGDQLRFGHPDAALPYSNLAAVCYHLTRFDLSLQLFGKALSIREQALNVEQGGVVGFAGALAGSSGDSGGAGGAGDGGGPGGLSSSTIVAGGGGAPLSGGGRVPEGPAVHVDTAAVCNNVACCFLCIGMSFPLKSSVSASVFRLTHLRCLNFRLNAIAT
jgi:hypothetical protein